MGRKRNNLLGILVCFLLLLSNPSSVSAQFGTGTGVFDPVWRFGGNGEDIDGRLGMITNFGVDIITNDTARISILNSGEIIANDNIIYGGSGVSSDLTLRSTTDAVKGQIVLDDQVSLWPSLTAPTANTIIQIFNATLTMTPGDMVTGFYFNPTVTTTGASAIAAIDIAGTYTASSSNSILSAFVASAIKTSSTAANPPGNFYAFRNIATQQSTGSVNVGTTGSFYGMWNAPIVRAANTSTLTIDEMVGFVDEPSFNSDVGGTATVTTRRGILIKDFTGTGSVGDNVGIDILSLTTGATANISLRSTGATTEMYHAGPVYFGALNEFRVNNSGNLIRINNVQYSWPGIPGAASTVLKNDGAGNLSWATSAAPSAHNFLDSTVHNDTTTCAPTEGDIIYGNISDEWDCLPGNATATNKFLRSVSGGSPSWQTLVVGDVPAHNLLSATHGDTTAASPPAVGSLIKGTTGAPNTWSTFVKGASAELPLHVNTANTDIEYSVLKVAGGGTGLTSGTSGGILGFTGATTLASSALLTNDVLIVGGGAGATPNSIAAGLGTTTTVLHGNAVGEPTWSAVSLTADVSGVLPTANGGTNHGNWTTGSVIFASSTTALNEDNTNFFWDNSAKALGLGTNSIAATRLHLRAGASGGLPGTGGIMLLIQANATTGSSVTGVGLIPGNSNTWAQFAFGDTDSATRGAIRYWNSTGDTADYMEIYTNGSAQSVHLGGSGIGFRLNGSTLYGHINSGGNIEIGSTSHTTKGLVNVQDELRLRTGFTTATGAATDTFMSKAAISGTVSGTVSNFYVLGVSGTLTQTSNPIGTVHALFTAGSTLAANFFTFQNTSGQPSLPSFIALQNRTRFQADTTNITSATLYGTWNAPTFTLVNGATAFTVTAYNAFADTPFGVSGLTITLRRGLWVGDLSTGTQTTFVGVDIDAQTSASTEISLRSSGTNSQMRHAGPANFGDTGSPVTTQGMVLTLSRGVSLSGNITDGFSAGMVMKPAYTCSGTCTITQHNYIDLNAVSLLTTTLTNAAVFRFNLGPGVHQAIDSGTTKSTPSTVNAWMKINVNGTIYYIPAYTSKTS